MKNHLRRVGLLLAISFIICSLQAAPVWQRLEADDFVIYSDASTNDIKEFAVNYAAFRQVLGELLIPAGQKLPRSTLLLFKRGSALKKYGPPTDDDDFKLLTFTTQVDDSALLALALSGDTKRASEIAYEFETVFALERAGYFLPIWMTQGTGMTLSSLECKKGKCIVGSDIDGYSEAFLNSGDQLPWDKFFLTGRGSEEYTGKKQAGVFQIQAWALMHWILLSQDRPREKFMALAEAIRGKSFLEAVQDVMGRSAKQFTTDIATHLNSKKGCFQTTFDEQKVKARLQLSLATDVDVHVQLANVLAAAGRSDESDIELNKAIALGSDTVPVKEAEARRALRNKEQDVAVKLYREAIIAGTKNPVAYLVSAAQRMDECGMGNTDYAGGGGPTTDVAIAEIKKALELSPGNMEAYRLLGRAFYILPNLSEERIAELTPALVSGAAGCVVRHYRALLYQRLEKLEQCAADLRLVLNDPDVPNWLKRSARDRLSKVEAGLKRAGRG